jgi:hypothetical protein
VSALPVVLTRRAARQVEAAGLWWKANRPAAPNALRDDRLSAHALREADADGLALEQIEAATLAGECIEDYPSDPRGSSCLVLGQPSATSAIHALWGFDAPSQQAILITVYRPDPQRWSDDFRRRRARDAGEAE